MRAESHALRSLLAAVALAAAASPLLSQGFAERAEVVVVEVPVQVVRDGQPVRGLTAADFELWEGRRKRAITGFEVVDLADASAGRRGRHEVPAAARRHFLLLFDLSFSQPRSVIQARQAARDLVLGLHSSDLVAVATYHASRGPNLVLGFSSDRRQIDAALEGLGLTGRDAAQDPLRLVLRDTAPQEELARTPQSRGAGLGDTNIVGDTNGGAMIQQIQSIADPGARADLETQRNAVTALTRSFADLAKLMGSVEGRKHVVYLSEGFDSRLVRGTDDVQKRDEVAAAAQSGEFWKVDGDELYGNTRTVNEVERMLEEFRRADCAIQAVDIAGLRGTGSEGDSAGGPSPASGKDSLLQMARGTGGELYENLNDLSSAMERMLGRTSVTYVLAYQPDDLKPDGSYRKLRVELKNGRGARLVHRPGFYAPRPFKDRNPFERLLEAGARVVSGDDAGTVGLAVLAAPFRTGGDRAYVPVLIEVDGPGLLDGLPGPHAAGRDLRLRHGRRGRHPRFLRPRPSASTWRRAEAALRQQRPEVLRPPGAAARPLHGAGPGAQRQHRRGRPAHRGGRGAGLRSSGAGAAAAVLPRGGGQVGDGARAAARRAADCPLPVHDARPAVRPGLAAGARTGGGGRRRPGGVPPGGGGDRVPGARRGRRGARRRWSPDPGTLGRRRRARLHAGDLPAAGPAARRVLAARDAARPGRGVRDQHDSVSDREEDRGMRRGLGIALLAALATLAATAGMAQRFTESTDILVVEVPVQVLQDGKPVRGLTAADFEVWDGRERSPVVGFEVLDLAQAPAAGPQRPAAPATPAVIPAAARRHFLLLFDLSFAEPKSIERARQAARDLLTEGLHPADLVGVATYSTTRGASLALGFTSDRQQVEAALAALDRPEMFDRSADPLRLLISSATPEFGSGGANPQAKNAAGKESDAAILGENLATIATEVDRGTFEQKSADVLALTRSFAELARALSTIQGRKHVLYLSEGFDSSLVLGTADQSEQERMAAASAVGEYWKIDSSARYGSTRASNELERMLEELRRADCVVQAVDIGGVRQEADNRSPGRDSLFRMADATGGELVRNFNDLSAALGQVLDRTAVTYVLAIQPDGVKRDGSYHRLRVELKDRARGAKVVHRAGFYAPRPYTERNPLERLLDAGRQVIAGEESGTVAAAVLAVPFRQAGSEAGNGEAYVPVLIEVDGPSLLAGAPAGGALPAEIYVYALDAAGAVRDFVTQTVALDLPKVGEALRQTGLKFFGHLDLPPGDYSLRVLVRNGATGASGLRVVPLRVPAPAAAGPVLLPPLFPEAPGKWLIVREAPRETDRQVPYPFQLGGEPFVPASRPVLEPGREARLALTGYGLAPAGEKGLQIRAQILGPDGREAGRAGLRLVGREPASPGAPDRLEAAFRPPALPAGEYVLRITITGGSTGATGMPESSSIPFVIADRDPVS